MKELEQEREEQKSKWQQFNNKAYSKNKKGQVCFCFVLFCLLVYFKALNLYEYALETPWCIGQTE